MLNIAYETERHDIKEIFAGRWVKHSLHKNTTLYSHVENT